MRVWSATILIVTCIILASSVTGRLLHAEKLALLHSERVSELGACEVPKPQVIHVSDHYPGRYFLPHCTLLHRCGKHAGCCGVDSLRCVAAQKEKVTLHFYSVRVFEDGTPPEKKIEKLVFSNHTKCACVPVYHPTKNDL
ncbi:Placenta growth factor, partial [Stegodyphus mimosarum]